MMAVRVLNCDVFDGLRQLADESIHCVVTSPPYWGLRDYGTPDQIGLEPTLQEHIDKLVAVFAEVRRVLRKDGTVWLNYGDSYSSGDRNTYRSGASDNKGHVIQNDMPRPKTPKGLKPKDLLMISNRLAIALQDFGWWARSEIIWSKPNPMPESVTDRPTSAHEKIWLLSKSAKYYFDQEAVREPAEFREPNSQQSIKSPHGRGFSRRGKALTSPRNDGSSWNECNGRGFNPLSEGRNIRNVWEIATAPYPEAHFATFPPELAKRCILAGCPEGGTVLDPFGGSGTTGLVADRLSRNAILIELNPEYAGMAKRRIFDDAPLFTDVEAA